MARFDLYRNPKGPGYLIDVQSGFLDHLRTRVVVPLMPPEAMPKPIRDLHPGITIAGERFLLVTQFLGAVTTRELGRAVGNLDAERDAITRALDALLTGL